MIDGTKARLFAHGAAQPCLIVKDMKFGDSEGALALFVGPGEGWAPAMAPGYSTM